MSETLDTRQDARGRANQRNRTRDAILRAGAELLRLGSTPSVVEAAAAARVSQATAYRYFPTQESLLAAVVDREMEAALQALDRSLRPEGNAEADLTRLAEAISGEIYVREPEHRSLLRLALDQWFMERRGELPETPLERGGRVAFIVDALEPLRPKLGEAGLFRLAEAVSLAIGIEAHMVLGDIWGLARNQSGEVIRWTCRALVRQALADASKNGEAPRPSGAARKALERSRRRRTQALRGKASS